MLLRSTAGLCLALSLLLPTAASAENLLIASAGGYRKPVMELIQQLPPSAGLKVEASFGHTKQIETQARQNPEVALLIGDLAQIEPTGLAARYEKFGSGKLAVIYSKALKLNSLEDLTGNQIKRFATPNHQRTIYGSAAVQCLKRTGLDKSAGSKMVESDGVPQVGTYVAMNEMDAGFVNLTEALAQGDRIGGYVLAPESCYDPIEITMAIMKPHSDDKAVKIWTDYIASPAAQAILQRYGLN